MKKQIKIFLAYFPVILIAGQVVTNLMYFILPEYYYAWAFYLNMMFGTNLLFALFLVGFTNWFRFCYVSRYAAYAQFLFALFYIIIQEDNIYNILFQIIVGCAAMVFTFRFFIVKFPLCKLSLLVSFVKSFAKTGNCEKAIHRWDRVTYHKIHSKYGNTDH